MTAILNFEILPVTSSFFDDLSDILDCVVGYNEQVYIVEDLSVRLDRSDDRSRLIKTNESI